MRQKAVPDLRQLLELGQFGGAARPSTKTPVALQCSVCLFGEERLHEVVVVVEQPGDFLASPAASLSVLQWICATFAALNTGPQAAQGFRFGDLRHTGIEGKSAVCRNSVCVEAKLLFDVDREASFPAPIGPQNVVVLPRETANR